MIQCAHMDQNLKDILETVNFIKDHKILAHESGFDGFYMALLERKESIEQKENRVQKEIE